ncbi:MAG: regulatory iron-sulfur-containing complex subunit RicT [Anaerolineales bacterium]|jgi:cell fate regulator YaaT (PSP1 superfamily)|nr:regulatory iron-sulfur-containing complex subunit RicT [Anaerolineales bacterium]
MQPNIYGIRFSKIGKIYHFDASHLPDLKTGEHVIVETTRGRQIGEVIQQIAEPAPPPDGSWKPIERRASAADLLLRQTWLQKQTAAMIECRARSAELRLAVKIVAAEYSFDGTRLTFMFATENDEKDEKVDLKSLRKDMQKMFSETQVDMRQIGPRDVAKMLGGMGACGLETRCCSQFLTEFSPISIKMAKEQGISLTPSEITGMCGRLRCCLIYEYGQYVAARKELPKRNKRVISPEGEGKVIDIYPMRNAVLVELPSKNPQERPLWKEFQRDLLEPWDELEALRRKSAAPCDRHEGGGCDCGKANSASTDESAAIAETAPTADPQTEKPFTPPQSEPQPQKQAGKQPNNRSSGKPGNRPGPKPENRRNGQPNNRPPAGPESPKTGQPESQPGGKPENRSNRRKPFRRKPNKGPEKGQDGRS